MSTVGASARRLAVPVGLALLVVMSGCVVRPGYGYTSVGVGAGYYDTSRCRWDWVDDGYGGYQQLNCWNTQYSNWQPYIYGNAYGRMYPDWYWGARVPVVAPPRTVGPPVMPARPHYGPGYGGPPGHRPPGPIGPPGPPRPPGSPGVIVR